MDVTRVDVEKVAEEFPQSRFRVLDTAIKKPGTCVLCLSSGGDGRQFVDFGKTVDFLGVVYFCTYCVAEVAKMLGFVPGLDMEKFLKGRRELDKARVEHIQVLKDQLDAARILLRNCHCDNADQLSNDSLSDVVDVEATEESDAGADDDDESSGVEGSGDVSEPSVDDDAEPEPEKPKRARRSSSS